MKLLVRNLARSTTEDELREMFEVLGKVQSCSLVIDKKTGNSKGFAFIEMPRPGDAKAAVKTLNGKNLAGNIIRVKKAAPKKAEADQPVSKNIEPEKAETEEAETEEVETEKAETEEVETEEVETEKVETEEIAQEKSEPEKHKIEKAKPEKVSNVNRNIWSK
jgi:RNA recognition motif-containing protein